MEPDDGALWRRVRTGDASAFGSLFERHADTIYNFCFRRTGDWDMAEDLVSLVFLEAWRRRDKDLPPDKVLAWLYGVATNIVRNQRRARRRHQAALARLASEALSIGSSEVHDRLEDQQQLARVFAVIRRLPRTQLDVFVLCTWSGLTYEEAAFALQIPVGTVRSRLSRANARIRELGVPIGHEETNETEPTEEAVQS